MKQEYLYFAYSATLRIFGDIPTLGTISETLGVQPTHAHRKGEKSSDRADPYPHDMWMYKAPLDESEPPHKHINALWATIKPHRKYLRQLKQSLTVDVFLVYRSNSCTAGFEVPYQSLEMFSELEIPLSISVFVV